VDTKGDGPNERLAGGQGPWNARHQNRHVGQVKSTLPTRFGDIAAVPTLDQIAENPALASELPPHVCGALATRAAAVVTVLGTRMATVPAAVSRGLDASVPDELLEVDEAARRLGIAPATLYRRARTTYRGLVVPTGTRNLRFSARRIEEYCARRVS